MKTRIIKRTHINGNIQYFIQRRSRFFGLVWETVPVAYDSIDEAGYNIPYHNGTPLHVDEIVQPSQPANSTPVPNK